MGFLSFGSGALKQDVIEQIDGTILNQLLADQETKRQYIDVRTPEEYYSRNIKAFTNIPLQVLQQRVKELDKETPVVIICASGGRSMSAASFLEGQGFAQILNVRGGMFSYRG
jgi:rhodanese-related sulfurtransferase